MKAQTFLGRYRAERLLGEGGMGRVYLGQQVDNGRQVVIKVMHDCFATDHRFRQAFEREMRLMMRFHHPNAVELYDAAVGDRGTPCIVMEYIPGVTLNQLVEQNGRLAPLRVGMLLGQLGQVLQAAHDNGIIHRDLSPVNVMVMDPDTDAEFVKVMDFGLARMGAGPYIPLEKLTGEGASIGGGTPDFVPPEQVRGEEVDYRGDLYAVGVLLYKMLTGYLPFEAARTTEEILAAHLKTPPPRFADVGLGQEVPAAVEAVVMACLAKFPEQRPQSAIELAYRYEKALGHKIIHGPVAEGTMLPATATQERLDPRTVMDHLEAWMPEPIAIVKLRGFAEDLGGEFLESEPGLIRFRLPDPTVVIPAPRGLFSVLQFAKRSQAMAEHILVELRLAKKETTTQNVLDMTVMMTPEEKPNRVDDPSWRTGCQGICRDLRAYFMSR